MLISEGEHRSRNELGGAYAKNQVHIVDLSITNHLMYPFDYRCQLIACRIQTIHAVRAGEHGYVATADLLT